MFKTFFSKKPFSYYFLIFLTLSFYLVFLVHKIDLTTADLGRHIKNGEHVFKNREVLFTNFYSFTNPSFATVNHHWGSGVIFYGIWKLGGFVGLQLFFIFISLSTFLVIYKLSIAKIGIYLASLIALIIIPLLGERTEIRPEMFSYLFAVVFYYLLTNKKIEKGKNLFFLPIFQLIWVNLHVYFFLGPFLIFVFLFEKIMQRKWKEAKYLTQLFLMTLFACLFNPFLIKGVLQPLLIFKEYGYRVLENQPLLFLEKLVFNPNFLVFKIVFGFLLLSTILRLIKRGVVNFSTDLILFPFFSTLGFSAIRNFYLFGLFSLIILTNNLKAIWPQINLSLSANAKTFILIIISTIVVLFPLEGGQQFFPSWNTWGLGLIKGNSKPAEFFSKNKLKGPLFNNYDLGGYLIFYLYPSVRVFVDNRPEAYPVDFFKKEYVPMQEEEKVWQKMLSKYNFNTIFFSMTDKTPWAQSFLLNRVRDKEWVAVYADKYAIIFLKNSEENKQLITRYKLPQNYFTIRKN